MRVGKRRDKQASSCSCRRQHRNACISRFLCGSCLRKEEKTRTKQRAKGRNCGVKIKMFVAGRNRIPDCRVAGQSGSLLVVRLAHDSNSHPPTSSPASIRCAPHRPFRSFAGVFLLHLIRFPPSSLVPLRFSSRISLCYQSLTILFCLAVIESLFFFEYMQG